MYFSPENQSLFRMEGVYKGGGTGAQREETGPHSLTCSPSGLLLTQRQALLADVRGERKEVFHFRASG